MMPGFAFWGLFVVFGLIVVGYLAWMVRVERRESAGPEPDEGSEAPGAGREAGSS